jgi:hypothetical protein
MLGDGRRGSLWQGETMKPVGTIIRAGFGWLTAIMTLVTGLPHFQCQCPNGAVKPFCFGIFCSSSGCCCGDVCSGGAKDSRSNARAVPTRKGRPACCRAHADSRPTPKHSDGPPRVEGRGCHKTLAQQQQLAPSDATKIVHDEGAADLAVLTSTIRTPFGSARNGTAVNGLHLAAPPPSDLVIVLQRFLI